MTQRQFYTYFKLKYGESWKNIYSWRQISVILFPLSPFPAFIRPKYMFKIDPKSFNTEVQDIPVEQWLWFVAQIPYQASDLLHLEPGT